MFNEKHTVIIKYYIHTILEFNITQNSQSTNCKKCDYQFKNINEKSNCPICGSTKKSHKISFNETVPVSDHIATIVERKRIIKNYYALVLGIIITSVAIYTFSIDSIFSVNAIITAFLGFLDTLAFCYFITNFHFKETNR